jgi:crotonobetainyl-CoA:carnitine CoA-transferase CaiB-like acyl-CoA transferase
VIDMAEGKGEMCGRFLADLGADVIRVEPPGGAPSRARAPLHGAVSLHFATHNAGKRGVVINHGSAGGREQLLTLLDGADIWIESARPGALSELGLGADVVRARNAQLVVLSITDFGQTGPYRDWVATEWTVLAMGGVLSRSGLPGREPLMPPGDLAFEVTSIQAAWAALVAYWNRLERGHGDHVDFAGRRPGDGSRRNRAGRRLRADPRPAHTRPLSDLPLSRRPRPDRPARAAPVARDARVAR